MTPKEVLAHMMSTVTEELFARTHENLIKQVQQNEEIIKNKNRNTVRKVLRKMASFDVRDVMELTLLSDKTVESVLDFLC